MNAFEFFLPTKILFGKGSFAKTGQAVKALGERAMIVCDPFASSVGLAARLAENLSAAGVSSVIYDKVIPNPTSTLIDEGSAIARAQKCKVIVGLGGGSSMDSAKGIAVAARHRGSIWKYAMGQKPITSRTLPMAAVTTTSGTGSQCTCFAVITNPKTNQKPGMGSPYIFPRLAVVDPELTLSAPPMLTANTGFDVFTHAVEALTSKAATPVTDMYAEKAIALVAHYLPICYKDGMNLDAREGMALADTYGGIAISHAVVSLGHVLAHVISGHFHDIAHGDALHSVYREVLRLNSKALEGKHQFIAQQLDPGNNDVVSAFEKFFGPFAFEDKLKARQVGDKMVEKIAQDTFTYMKGVVDLNPVEVNIDHARTILIKSLS